MKKVGGPRFERALSAEAEALLAPGLPLRVLIDHEWTRDGLDADSIDPQLREKNAVMLYHGTTRPLKVTLGDEAGFSADPRYEQLCGEVAKSLFETRGPPAAGVSELLRAYVPLAVRRIDDHSSRFYGRDTEGGWQNRLARAWGRLCSTASPWLVFDRESVLGFAHDPDSEKFFKPLAEPYLHLKSRLQREDPKRWGKPKYTLIVEDESAGSETKKGNPPIASELDFLALDASGQLVCIELKRSKNASGIYWGPLQAGLYRDAFRRALPAIRESMQNLIRQKLSLGLLPASAERGLREHSLRSVTAALIIAEPNERSTCWEKLAYVQSHLEPDQRVPVYGVTGWGLEDIEIRRRP